MSVRAEYGAFSGIIDQNSVQRIIQGIAPVTDPAANVGRIHLMFHSTGGGVGDGICLYNFFRALPVELVLYNTGAIHSIAVVAYLGAKKRKTSARATFVLHRTSTSPQSATATRLKTLTESVTLDDSNTESILREHITLPDELWARLNYDDLVISAQDAVKFGIAHEIEDFLPPPQTRIAYI